MKLVYLLTTAILGLTLAGCTTEELDSLTNTQQNAIGFSALNTHVGRALLIDNSNIKNYDFNVYAYTQDGKAFMGTNDDMNDYFNYSWNGVNIVTQNGVWNYANPTDMRYWPNESLNFYAISPSLATVLNQDNGYFQFWCWHFCSEEQTIDYVSFDEYRDSNQPSNIDIMYATALNKTKDSPSVTNGRVPLHFNHIFSQIIFKAKSNNTNLTVEIDYIKICNVKLAGKFTLPKPTEGSTSIPVATANNWSYKTASQKNDAGIFETTSIFSPTLIKEANKTITYGDGIVDLTSSSPMLLIPQKLTAWDLQQSKGDNTEQSYLTINCKLRKGNTYIHGDESNYAELYMPFSADWQPGKRYIYTLIFGGGYDKDGNPILSPINFEASTEGWVESTSTINANE